MEEQIPRHCKVKSGIICWKTLKAAEMKISRRVTGKSVINRIKTLNKRVV